MANEPKPIRDKAETLLRMTKEAERVSRKVGAEASIVICIFREGDKLVIQDAGKFPMLPEHLYNIMVQGHLSGQFSTAPKSKIIKPH